MLGIKYLTSVTYLNHDLQLSVNYQLHLLVGILMWRSSCKLCSPLLSDMNSDVGNSAAVVVVQSPDLRCPHSATSPQTSVCVCVCVSPKAQYLTIWWQRTLSNKKKLFFLQNQQSGCLPTSFSSPPPPFTSLSFPPFLSDSRIFPANFMQGSFQFTGQKGCRNQDWLAELASWAKNLNGLPRNFLFPVHLVPI